MWAELAKERFRERFANGPARKLSSPGGKLMSITRYLTVQLASVALGVTCGAGPAFAQSAHIVVPADKVQWGPAPPVLPAGAQLAVLEGNPSEKGAITL